MDDLAVCLFDIPVGTLRRVGVEDYRLEYDLEWSLADDSVPLSLSLPLSTRRHTGRVVADYLDNLLPDDPAVRQRWATDAGLDSVEAFVLLGEYGNDTAGAASFSRAGEVRAGYRAAIADDQIAERIRALRRDQTAWHDPVAPQAGQFSLAGAQAKFSLARHEGQWFETSGSDPSTHLVKPQVSGVPDGELIEFLVMRTALALGIPSAAVDVFDHDGEHALVVERFDRTVFGGRTIRLHQEDLLQALGRPRLSKFEEHGGPGIDRITALLAQVADDDSRRRYAVALVFCWIVLSSDAHAKNFSLFVEPDGARLTPLYDLSSVIPYLGDDRKLDERSWLERARNVGLAVRYGAGTLAGDVSAVEVGGLARRSGMAADELLAIAAIHLEDISDTMAAIAGALPPRLQTDTVARAVAWMPLRAKQASQALGL